MHTEWKVVMASLALPDWVVTGTPWVISFIGIGAGVLVAVINKSGTRENLILDQVQEERNVAVEHLHEARQEMRAEREEMRKERAEIKLEREEMRKEREETQRRLAEIERHQHEAELREVAALEYIRALQNHIVGGHPPPPPMPPNRLIELLQAYDWVEGNPPE